jgi:hypothetical protein
MCISKGPLFGHGPNHQFIRASTGSMSCTLICCRCRPPILFHAILQLPTSFSVFWTSQSHQASGFEGTRAGIKARNSNPSSLQGSGDKHQVRNTAPQLYRSRRLSPSPSFPKHAARSLSTESHSTHAAQQQARRRCCCMLGQPGHRQSGCSRPAAPAHVFRSLEGKRIKSYQNTSIWDKKYD